mgnify:CR=1 FL=1
MMSELYHKIHQILRDLEEEDKRWDAILELKLIK